VPEPTSNNRPPKPAGPKETPLPAAPPVPGSGLLPVAREQPLGPAPTLPVPQSLPAQGSPAERPLAAAPQPVRPTSGERQLPAAPAVPGTAGARPGGPATPLPAVTNRSIGRRPEVPLARPAPVTAATPRPAMPLPGPGPAPIGGTPAAPQATGYHANPATVRSDPAGAVPQPQVPGQAGQPAPPDHPAWLQPPATPPPVPPPGMGSQPAEHPTPRPIAWTPHSRSGPVGSRVAAALDGGLLPAAKTSTAKSLRRQSRSRSSMLAVTFLLVAATFLIGMVLVLLLSLAS
jgi:hypothetical protein